LSCYAQLNSTNIRPRYDGGKCLDLLSTPPAIRLAHILRWFDGRDELEDYVHEPDDADYCAKDDVHGVVLEEDGAAEDVDFRLC
jgi:hypothetical protein